VNSSRKAKTWRYISFLSFLSFSLLFFFECRLDLWLGIVFQVNQQTLRLREYLEKVLQDRRSGKKGNDELLEVQKQVVDFHEAEFPKIIEQDEAIMERISV